MLVSPLYHSHTILTNFLISFFFKYGFLSLTVLRQTHRSSTVCILKWNFPWWANPHESLRLLKSLEVSLGLLLAPECIRGRHGNNWFQKYKAQLCGSSHHTSHSSIHEKADFDVCIAALADSLKSHQVPGAIPWAHRGHVFLISHPTASQDSVQFSSLLCQHI